jgi:hypothetical protein
VQRRRRRGLFGVIVALFVLAGVSIHAYRSSSHAAPSAALMQPAAATEAPDGQPTLQSLATGPEGLQLDVPITQRRITAIVYHGAGTGLVPLTPAGHQHNANLLTRISNALTGRDNASGPGYWIDSSGQGPATGSVDIGAVAGTSVYAPADGRIVSVQPYIISGQAYGSIIQIQPTTAPTLLVTVTNVKPTSNVVVGKQVTAAETKLGTVIDLSTVINQELANYTSDAGNHAHIEVNRAPAAAPIL